ncbi:MAG TPA: cupredoxin domain-containing protein [Acidimicrobiales bacterium]|nr:cupredoxin domain-containing protein [Acidimicrobiales bacterium]
MGLKAAPAALALALLGCGSADATQTVVLTARHSRFDPAVVPVRAGTTVRIVVRNLDPIDHELIVGDDEVQRRHETGTEPHHGDRPGEVSVPAGTTAATTFRMPASGDVPFGCHLPGHWAYGMQGVLTTRT